MLYKSRPVEELTKEELLEALQDLYIAYLREVNWHEKICQVNSAFTMYEAMSNRLNSISREEFIKRWVMK